MKYKELVKRRKERMKGKTGKLILIVFLYMLLSALITMVPIAGFLVITIIGVPLFYGFCKEMCLVLNGEQHGVLDWFEIGFTDFAKAWQCELWYMVRSLGPWILFIVSERLFEIVINNNNGLAGLAGGLTLIAALIWKIIVVFNYSMYIYELIYHSNQKAKDILENAKRKIQKYKKELFCIFAKWFLISVSIIAILVGTLILVSFYVIGTVIPDPSTGWFAIFTMPILWTGAYILLMILAVLLCLVLCVMATIMLPYILADLNELYNEIDKESNGQPEMLDNPVTQ